MNTPVKQQEAKQQEVTQLNSNTESWQHLASDTDYQIPLLWYPAQQDQAEANFVILPALGTDAKHYTLFAQALNNQGFSVAVVEHRGYGESTLRPSRNNDWGFKTVIFNEIAESLRWVKSHNQSTPTYLIGHSLGGQLSVASSALLKDLYDGFILIACASPFFGNYSGNTKFQLRLLTYLAPLLSTLYGYFPGPKVGFAGNESCGLFRDWLQLAKFNQYDIKGIDRNINPHIERYNGNTLSLSFQQDQMAPLKAVTNINSKLKNAKLTHKEFTESELGCRSGHFDWLRKPDAVCIYIINWLERL